MKIPILMYHSLSNFPKGTKMRGLHVPIKSFKIQMKMMKILGYTGLSMTHLLPYLSGEKKGKVFGITFDDGYKNNIKAISILKQYNFTATCYIVANKIDMHNSWDKEKQLPQIPLMSEIDINYWIESGMEIGSHTLNHFSLLHDKTANRYDEINLSKQNLEKLFNVPIKHFCYPYGHYNKDLSKMVSEAGYQSSTTVERGRIKTPCKSFFNLRRVPIWRHTYLLLFLIKLLTNYEDRKNS